MPAPLCVCAQRSSWACTTPPTATSSTGHTSTGKLQLLTRRLTSYSAIVLQITHITQNAQEALVFWEACHSKLLVAAGLTYQLEV